MTLSEKLIFHQIHPAKLATDVTTSIVSSALLWHGQWVAALISGFAPSVIVTALLCRLGDLDRLRDSAFGKYLSQVMTRAVEAQRMLGQIVMWMGAWRHDSVVIVIGATMVVLAWLGGVGRSTSVHSRS